MLFCFFQSESCTQKHFSTTGHSRPKPGWGLKNIFNSVWQPLLLFYKTNLRKKIIKAYQNTWGFWQQLFGLLHNIAISLKSIRLTWKWNKNHCWKMVNISVWARTFSSHHPMIITPTSYPLDYRHRREEDWNFFYYGSGQLNENSGQIIS